MNPIPPSHVVIIGGGIIGCTTAYYLSRRPNPPKVTLIEASSNGPAQGASGKAAGLVAKWAYPKSLVNVSFAEHVKLAQEHNGSNRWGWRFVGCGNWEGRTSTAEDDALRTGDGRRTSLKKMKLDREASGPSSSSSRSTSKGLPHDLLWVKEALTDSYSPLAPDGDTAQVHPYRFTTSMLELAVERGVEFIHGKVSRILITQGNVTGVQYLDRKSNTTITINASHVLLAAGAWSSTLLPALPITGTRAHSITIQPQPNVTISPYVLFTDISIPMNHTRRLYASPEIYSRPGNEVYACGPGDNEPLPACVDDVVVNQNACDDIIRQVSSISDELGSGEVTKRQACYLPNVSTGDGNPIIGEAVHVAKGLYIAAGHTCWGICNSPGTALALTELIIDGKIKSANLASLSPDRYL